jgi:hypothetical protein
MAGLLLNHKWGFLNVKGSFSQDVSTSDAMRHETGSFHSTEQLDSGLLGCDNWLKTTWRQYPGDNNQKLLRTPKDDQWKQEQNLPEYWYVMVG